MSTKIERGEEHTPISVYIPSYNQKAYLGEAVNSILAQTALPMELIIVDDCSSDGSQSLIAEFAREHPGLIRPFYREKNHGIAATRNFACRQAEGEWLTYLDADDRFLPRKLEMELKVAQEHPEADVVYSNVAYIDQVGGQKGTWIFEGETPPAGNVFPEVLGRQFPGNALFRNELTSRDSLIEAGLYDEQLRIYEDWDIKIRLTKEAKVAYCPQVLVEYRQHPDGLSRSEAALHLQSAQYIYRKNLHLLEDLPDYDRHKAERQMRRILARMAWEATVEAFFDREGPRAIRYWLHSLRHNPIACLDPRPFARQMLPERLYARLREAYQTIRGYSTE